MVLWYGESTRLVKSNVHNFFSNPMRYKDYSQVFLKDVTPVASETKKASDKK
jgi:hypothetical protein